MATKSERQQRDEKAVFEALEPAGWKRTVKSDTFEVADLTYANGEARLEAEHRWWENALYVTLDLPDGSDDLILKVEYGDTLDPLLRLLRDEQDRITWADRERFAHAVAAVSPETFRVTPTELVKVSAEA